jgi:two-component system response regulator HydG
MKPDASPYVPLLESVAALARSMEEEFDPRRFLGRFSEKIAPALPHTRIVVFRLGEDEKTFTVFAEHDPKGVQLHEGFWSATYHPHARHLVSEWAIGAAFRGELVRVDDIRADARFAKPSDAERRLVESGLRSGLLLPLRGGGRIFGAIGFSNTAPRAFTDEHERLALDLAQLVAPSLQNAIAAQQERRRAERAAVLRRITRELGASLDVRGVFERLAAALRPILDFDVMGIGVQAPNGRDVDVFSEVNPLRDATSSLRKSPDDFSLAPRILRGESVLVGHAPSVLDPKFALDREVLGNGIHSMLDVPLFFGEQVGGLFYVADRRAYWYERADLELVEEIAAHVVVAVQHQRLAEDRQKLARVERRVRVLEDELGGRRGFDRIVGGSTALKDVLKRAHKVAATDTTVLITGESGTGKELFARAIHVASARADGPFVAFNCAALPETLLESDLFGHEKGAFTGADRQKAGRFELAAGGSLFLDEVGELAPATQAKFLRVLQERAFERVGGTQTIAADVRLIAATNRDLAAEVARGRFREDLFYRLDVFTLRLPPLRERDDDVAILADHFARELGARMGRSGVTIGDDARAALRAHPWRGNIRELQNAIERALIVSDGEPISAAQLGLDASRAAPAAQTSHSVAVPAVAVPTSDRAPQGSTLPDWERHLVVDALAKARGNKSKAAALLGVTRSQLYTRMKRFGLAD